MITEQLVVDAAKEVLETTAQSAVQGARTAGGMESEFHGVIARLSLVGQRSAELVVLCAESLATQLAGAMMGMEAAEVDEALVTDALGELVNQFGGTMKRRLAASYGEMVLSVPSVICGDMKMRVLSDAPPVCVDVQLEHGPVHVRVWIPKKTGQGA